MNVLYVLGCIGGLIIMANRHSLTQLLTYKGNNMIQNQLNAVALDQLPLINELIKNVQSFEANQMRNRTIRECLSSEIALDNMNDEQLHEFQIDLINIFKHFGWCK